MSGKVVGWAFDQDTQSPIAKLILVKLADNSNEEGLCWPSVDLIVRHTGLSERAVRKHLGDLAALGLIAIVPTFTAKGQSSNRYQLSVPPPARGAGGARHQVQAPGASDAPTPMHGVQGHMEEPSKEPSKNLRPARAAGDAGAPGLPQETLTALSEAMGGDAFATWLDDGKGQFQPGPPVRITLRLTSHAKLVGEKYASAFDQVFGAGGWEVLSREKIAA